jgi:hypothetical protein
MAIDERQIDESAAEAAVKRAEEALKGTDLGGEELRQCRRAGEVARSAQCEAPSAGCLVSALNLFASGLRLNIGGRLRTSRWLRCESVLCSASFLSKLDDTKQREMRCFSERALLNL